MKYNSSQLIADYTVLAEAAYSDFSRLIYQEAESSPEKFEREEHDAIMYEDPGTKENIIRQATGICPIRYLPLRCGCPLEGSWQALYSCKT